jgi:rhamnosyltransferase
MVFTHALRSFIHSAGLSCIPMHDIVVMLYALGFGGIVWDEEPRFSYRVHGENVVAKNNKSLLQKLRTVYWNWRNSSKNSMSTVAAEMLRNAKNLSREEVAYLTWMSTYRTSIRSKWKLLTYKGTRCAFPREKRSYILRMILNML